MAEPLASPSPADEPEFSTPVMRSTLPPQRLLRQRVVARLAAAPGSATAPVYRLPQLCRRTCSSARPGLRPRRLGELVRPAPWRVELFGWSPTASARPCASSADRLRSAARAARGAQAEPTS